MFLDNFIKWLLDIPDKVEYEQSSGLKDIIADLGKPAPEKTKQQIINDYFWFLRLSSAEYSALHEEPSFIFLGYYNYGQGRKTCFVELRPEVAYANMGKN